jgi:hypothetical protein
VVLDVNVGSLQLRKDTVLQPSNTYNSFDNRYLSIVTISDGADGQPVYHLCAQQRDLDTDFGSDSLEAQKLAAKMDEVDNLISALSRMSLMEKAETSGSAIMNLDMFGDEMKSFVQSGRRQSKAERKKGQHQLLRKVALHILSLAAPKSGQTSSADLAAAHEIRQVFFANEITSQNFRKMRIVLNMISKYPQLLWRPEDANLEGLLNPWNEQIRIPAQDGTENASATTTLSKIALFLNINPTANAGTTAAEPFHPFFPSDGNSAEWIKYVFQMFSLLNDRFSISTSEGTTSLLDRIVDGKTELKQQLQNGVATAFALAWSALACANMPEQFARNEETGGGKLCRVISRGLGGNIIVPINLDPYNEDISEGQARLAMDTVAAATEHHRERLRAMSDMGLGGGNESSIRGGVSGGAREPASASESVGADSILDLFMSAAAAPSSSSTMRGGGKGAGKDKETRDHDRKSRVFRF